MNPISVTLRVSQYHLIYDDRCPICRTGVETVKRHDTVNLVNALPASEAVARNPGLAGLAGRLQEELHLITPEGKVYRGAEAVAVLATVFPKSKIIGRLVLLPVIKPIARHIYRAIARHRMQLSRLTALK